MSFWSRVRGFFGVNPTYVVVWREYTAGGTVMKGEPIAGKSDMDAISLTRAQFMHARDCEFWVLFRADDRMLTAEQGPKFGKWQGDFTHIASDSHVLHTLQSVRRHRKGVSRPLHKVRLKRRGQTADSDRE